MAAPEHNKAREDEERVRFIRISVKALFIRFLFECIVTVKVEATLNKLFLLKFREQIFY